MNLNECNRKPDFHFYFGTDIMGRDIFSMVWYGGRISLLIGFLSSFFSTILAIFYGSISGIAGEKLDQIMMQLIEILISIPSILTIIFVQAILDKNNVVSIAIVIGLTGWMNMAKVVRSEVRQIRNSEYVIASWHMGGNFLHILKEHFFPNFFPAILFIIITNIGQAIGTEATLSFLGIGLPIEIISWGSMLSLAEKALLLNSWWSILIPGLFLVVTLTAITNIGNYMRKENYKTHSNL